MIFHNFQINIIIILSFLFTNVIPAFSQHDEEFGYLKVEFDSAGIEVQLNNKILGCTPLPIISLHPGNYKISVLHPNPYLWGNLDWQDQIIVIPHDTIVVRPKFQNILNIRTEPFDAEVFLNNEFQGMSPLTILLDTKDNGQLLLKKEGYQDYLIDLQRVKNNFLNVKLIVDQHKINLNTLEKEIQRKANGRYRTLTYGFWGLSILTGLTTVYLKDQADEKYRQYLEAGSLNEMNKYYNDSKRYDRYTYVSLGILQGCFVLSFYFLMRAVD